MKKPRYTDRQIAQALRQTEQGTPVAGVCRKLGARETTFSRREKRYAGGSSSSRRRIDGLKQVVVDLHAG